MVTTEKRRRRRSRQQSSRRRGLTLALYEAGFANVFTELTGGPRQVGFALLLGARDLHIGLLSALPHLAHLSQLTASFILERTGQRKSLALLTAGLGRLVWVAIVLLPLSCFDMARGLRVWGLVAIVALSSLFMAMNNTPWLSWLGDLVPSRLRGRYFGRRNIVIAAVGMSIPLLASMFIDTWKIWFAPQAMGGFLVVFGAGIICGCVALVIQGRMPDIPPLPGRGMTFFARLALPLRDVNFRRFILFHLCWQWSVNLAAPFFTVYMLKDLDLSYTFVTGLTSLTALANMAGMRFWGQMTDRFSAKPVGILGGIVAALLPGLWLATLAAPPWAVLPVVHILGGFGWAALNLNLNTLLLALAPPHERAIYLSVYAALTGLSTAVAPVVGGLLARSLQRGLLPLPPEFSVYLLMFAVSCVLRLLSLLLFLRVREPREVPLLRLLPVFGNFRTLNTMVGFEALFHYGYLQGERIDRFIVSSSGTIRQALAQLDQITDAYAAEAETHVRDFVDAGEDMFESLRTAGQVLTHELDAYVDRCEARMGRWITYLATPFTAVWRCLMRWQRDDNSR